MKQTKLWLATIAALLCSLTASAHDFVVGGIYYNITSSTDLTVAVTYGGSDITEYENEYRGAVTIPATVTYNSNTYRVTSIGEGAFMSCSSLTSITIPEGVTSIGGYAFAICSSLTSITIPESVTSIGKDAFSFSSSLAAFYISSIETWCKVSFSDSPSSAHDLYLNGELVTELVIPKGVTSIGNYAFCNCTGLTFVTIPEGVTSIGMYAFSGCSSLTSITIPESVTEIGLRAFHYQGSLTSIVVEEGNKVYDSRDNCNAIIETSSNTLIKGCNSTIIPESVVEIESEAFYNCSDLTSITIPEDVTEIGNNAFNGCTSLKEVIIEDGNTTLSLGANYNYGSNSNRNTVQGLFYDCPLETVYLGRNLSYDSGSSYGYSPFYKSNGVPAIIFGNSVTSIPSYLFYENSRLTSIAIPESVTSIGGSAFYGCSNLNKVINNSSLSLYKGSSSNGYVAYYAKVVYQGSGLTTVGDFQFYTSNGVHSLVNYIGEDTGVVLPDSYNGDSYNIGDYAFRNCSSITSITIPAGVTSIGNYAFDECTSLKEVIIEDGSTELSLGYNYYYSNGTGQGLFYDCPLETVYLGRNLSYVSGQSHGYSPFYNRAKLTSVTIGDSVIGIGNSAFRNCSSLASITIPAGVTSIGNYAFDECTSLKEVIIEDGSTELSLGYNYYYSNGTGQGLFYDCPLETVYLGRNLSYVSGQSHGYSPFYNRAKLTSVTIGDSVIGIGNSAFRNCSSLASITIPAGVTSIGDAAFDGTVWLINQSDGPIYVGKVLYGYKGTMLENTSIEVREGTVSLNSYAFSDCSNLTSITIPESVTSIGSSAFSGCSSLTSIAIPESVTEIGAYAFDNCTSLKEVIIEDGSTTLSLGYNYSGITGQGLFYDCPLETVYLGRNLSYVSGQSCGYSPFYKSNRFPTISFGNNLTSIPSYLFYKNSSLTSVTFPESVTSIGSSAFSGCSSLTSIAIPESSKLTSIGEWAFSDCSGLTSITIPESVTSIGYRAFSGCYSLTSITIPEGVTSIGEAAFYNCSRLYKVINNSNLSLYKGSSCNGYVAYYAKVIYNESNLTSVGDFQFYTSDSIHSLVNYIGEDTEIVLPDSYNGESYKIGDCAFFGCSGLTSITIPEGVAMVGDNAFSGCYNLATVYLSNIEALINIKKSGNRLEDVDVYIDGTELAKLTSVVIPSSVTSIPNYAFYGCRSLTSIAIPESVTKIGEYAFRGCSSLTSITIPASVTSIGNSAFDNCTALRKVTFEDGNNTLSLGYNKTSSNDIGEGLFYDCPLTTLYLGRDLYYSDYYSNGFSPFAYVSSLSSVTIGENVTSIGSHAFYGCYLNFIDIPENSKLTTIGEQAFFYCNIGSITIPEGVTSIGDGAFACCYYLNSITSYAMTPPRCYWSAYDPFYKVSKTIPVYVPQGTLSKYEKADSWKEFSNIKERYRTYNLTYVVDGQVYKTYSVKSGDNITMPEEPTKEGYTFSGWSDVPETMPAEDVTISGTFTANVYKVYYYVGEELVHIAEVAYGEAIPEYIYETTIEGDEFLGWVGETYDTMPAHDVTYTANITNGIGEIENSKLKIENSVIYDLSGRKIVVDDLRELEKGTYIINGKKTVIK